MNIPIKVDEEFLLMAVEEFCSLSNGQYNCPYNCPFDKAGLCTEEHPFNEFFDKFKEGRKLNEK